LLKLRGFYHDEHLLETRLTESPKVTPERAYGVFIHTRPLDFPSVYFALIHTLTKHPSTVICGATQLLLDGWVQRRKIPAWEMTAFWYASAAIAGQLSVVTLNKLLDAWWDSIQSAIGYMFIHGDDSEPPDRKKYPRQAHDWWGYRSDLRHAGLLEACEEKRLTKEQWLQASDKVCNHGMAYPSACQEWGPYGKAYAAEIAKEAERRERETEDINPDWT
jgi:hypothetical protein